MPRTRLKLGALRANCLGGKASITTDRFENWRSDVERRFECVDSLNQIRQKVGNIACFEDDFGKTVPALRGSE